jgi:hypothetical protein
LSWAIDWLDRLLGHRQLGAGPRVTPRSRLPLPPHRRTRCPQIARVDFNVPLEGTRITNTQRIDAAIPTIKYALEKGAKVSSSTR